MKPYYQDEAVTLYHGDCLDVLPSLGEVDLVVTSPPYNLGVTMSGSTFGHYRDGQTRGGNGKWSGVDRNGIGYSDHDDAMPPAEYVEWQKEVLHQTWCTLSRTGAIFYNHKPRVQADTLWTPLELNPGLPVRQVIIWARSGGMNFAPTHFVPTHEWIIVFAKQDWRLKSQSASGLGDVWRVHQEPNEDHPAPFPLAIPSRAIDATSARLVLDPFAGSGTTLRAAKALGRSAIGIEKSERYCEVIAKHLAQGVFDFDEAVS